MARHVGLGGPGAWMVTGARVVGPRREYVSPPPRGLAHRGGKSLGVGLDTPSRFQLPRTCIVAVRSKKTNNWLQGDNSNVWYLRCCCIRDWRYSCRFQQLCIPPSGDQRHGPTCLGSRRRCRERHRATSRHVVSDIIGESPDMSPATSRDIETCRERHAPGAA